MTAAEWVRVESPTSLDWIDGFLHSGSTEIDPLPIQVTKAYPAIWGELARNPSGVSKNRDVNEIRQTLMEAIEKKKAHVQKSFWRWRQFTPRLPNWQWISL
jgi:hypothetical protein